MAPVDPAPGDPSPGRVPPPEGGQGGDDGQGADDGQGGGPSPLLMLVMVAVLVVGGYWLAMKLKDMASIQDCVMSGRTNCAPISR